MKSVDKQDQDVLALEQLSDEYIRQSKYILNAAIMEVLRDRNPEDVATAKALIFEILEDTDHLYERVKYALIDGRFLDAAEQLFDKAERSPDIAAKLYRQSAILYAPFMSLKAIQAYEKADLERAELGPYRAQMARLYHRLADIKNAEKQETLAKAYAKENPESQPEIIDNAQTARPYAANVMVLPLTLERDGARRFSANLNLKDT